MYLIEKNTPESVGSSVGRGCGDAIAVCTTGNSSDELDVPTRGDQSLWTVSDKHGAELDKQPMTRQDLDVGEQSGMREIDQARSLDSNASRVSDESEYIASDFEKSEFSRWAALRRQEVESTINSIADEFSGHKHMLNMIKDKSEYFEPRESTQDPYKDEDWAYEKTQELQNIIYSHPNSGSLEIISINCKQLMCEVIGKDNGNAWIPVVVQIMISAKNIIRSEDHNDEAFGVVFMGDGEESYFYKVFEFTKG